MVDRQGKTTGRAPDWNSLYGLSSQKWPLGQPEISFCGSCGLWSCTAATTQFNNAHFEFYFWTKGKVLEQGVWTHQGPVLRDEHRVGKRKKGGWNNYQVTDNVTTESSLVPHRLCIPSFLCCCSLTLFCCLLSSPWNEPLSLAAAAPSFNPKDVFLSSLFWARAIQNK